jgi:hypothetical protein
VETITAWPQLEQNFAPAGSAVPQLLQLIESAVPQFRQNFAPSGFSVPQDKHFIVVPSLFSMSGRAASAHEFA